MKKYLLKIAALVLFTGTLVSCSEDKVYYDESKYTALASFSTDSGLLGLTETVSQREIQVQVSNRSSVARVIEYEVDQEATTAAEDQYEVVSSSLVVPANSYYGTIIVKSTYLGPGHENDPAVDLVLKLKSVEGARLEPNETRFVLTIFHSCDYKSDLVGNSFTASVMANPYGSFAGMTTPSFSPIMTQVSEREFTVNSLWGPNFVATITNNSSYNNQYLAPAKIIINADSSLKILPIGDAADYITGYQGSYDPCTNTFKYTLYQDLFSDNKCTVDVVLNPN